MSQYSELLRAIADGKRLETAYAGAWHPMTEKAAFERMARGDDIEWREAPQSVLQVTCAVPAPMARAPQYGDVYYFPSLEVAELWGHDGWSGDQIDNRLFSRGLCYATKEDAIARARAMLKIESV